MGDPKIIESLGAVGTLAVIAVITVRAVLHRFETRLAAIEEEQKKIRQLLEQLN